MITTVKIPLAVIGKKDVLNAVNSLVDALERLARIKSRLDDKSVKAEERVAKALKDKATTAVKAEDTVAKAMEKSARFAETSERRMTENFDKEIRKRARIREREEKAAEAGRRRFADSIGRNFGNAATRGLHAASGIATMALGAMGGFGLVDATRDRALQHGHASAIALSGSKKGGEKFNSNQVLKSATAVGIESGIGVNPALDALDEFTKRTGNLKMGMEILRDISVYADASGTDIKDLAGASAELFSSGTVKNGTELKDILGSLIEMGKDGAVELKDLAAGFGRITASAGQFVGDKGKNVRTLTAFAEMSKKYAAASPREALTSVQNLASDIAKHGDKFAALPNGGVNVLDKGGKFLRDPLEILKESMFKTGGLSVPQQHKLFGERSFRAVAGASEIFNKSMESSTLKDPKAKMEEAWSKVTKEFDELTASMMTPAEAEKAAAERRAEVDRQMAKTMEELRVKIGDELIPVVMQIAGTLKDATPDIVKFVHGLADIASIFTQHPWAGLGAIVGAFIVKELVIAAIGATIKAAIAGAINNMPVPNLTPGATGNGVGGALLTAGAALGAGLSLEGGKKTWDQTDATIDSAGGFMNENSGNEVFKNLVTGKASPEEISSAKTKLANLKNKKGMVDNTSTNVFSRFAGGVLSAGENAVDTLTSAFGVKTPEYYRAGAKQAAEAKTLEDSGLAQAIMNLERALNRNSELANGNSTLNNKNRETGLADRGGATK